MLTAQELKTSPLFHDISYEEYRRMLTCFQAAQRSYVPEEQVYDFTSSRTDAVGIVERGQVSLIRIDEAGVATVLEDMGPGGVFGRHLAFAGFAADSLEVVARTACDILFIDNSCIFKRCENACTHHSTLVYNMMNLLSNKTRSLSERVDVLSRRSIREKLLCCLDKEIPHGTAVEITKFSERDDEVIEIDATIYCEKNSHKGIIIGKGGSMLKKVSTLARQDMERFMGTKVYLQTWVKVKENWRDNVNLIRNFGYRDE
mgnify:CR=1 FL=1